jgi:hypothetical protein
MLIITVFQTPEAVSRAALQENQRPCFGITLQGYAEAFPGDLHMVFSVVKRKGHNPVHVAFVQLYEHAFGTPTAPHRHPLVPASGCYYLADTFGVYPVAVLTTPIRMVPNFRQLTTRRGGRDPNSSGKQSSAATGKVTRLLHFAVSKITEAKTSRSAEFY